MKASTILLGLFLGSTLLLGCASNIVKTGAMDNYPPIASGADRDEHNCISSAGYVWSSLKADCIRLWENATEMVDEMNRDATVAAYLIISDDKMDAELFMPGLTESLRLKKSGNQWTNTKKNYFLRESASGTFALYNADETLLYKTEK